MIVFRGERVDGGGMVEGYYIYDGFTSKHWIYPSNGFGSIVHPESLAVGDTNLPDKNGTKIFGSFEYEEGKMSRGGDILADEDESTYTVFFEGGSLIVSTRTGQGFYVDELPICDVTGLETDFTVIGNTHSTEELLEESNG